MDYGNLNSEIPIIENISNGEMSDGFDETDHPDLTCLDLIQSHSQSASPLLQNFDLEDPITRENSHINGANSSNSYQETPLVSLPVSSLSQSTSISWNPQTFSKTPVEEMKNFKYKTESSKCINCNYDELCCKCTKVLLVDLEDFNREKNSLDSTNCQNNQNISLSSSDQYIKGFQVANGNINDPQSSSGNRESLSKGNFMRNLEITESKLESSPKTKDLEPRKKRNQIPKRTPLYAQEMPTDKKERLRWENARNTERNRRKKENEIRMLKEEINNLKEEINNLKEEINNLSENNRQLKQELELKNIQICKLEADANKISGNHNNIDSHQNDIEFLKKIVESLQKNNDTLQKNNDVFHKLLMK